VRIEEIWRYPVKSMGGHRMAAVDVTELGIEGDRTWGLVDDATGMVLTGRREPRLLMAGAALENGRPVVTAEGGHEMRTSADLSAWLGRSVTLTPAGQEGGVYENPMDYENDADWATWQGPGGAWHDSASARVSIVSLGSVGDWDPRRFRANLLVDGSDEEELVGQHVTVGEAVLQVVKQINRCVMVTRAQPGLDRDLNVLKAVNRTRDSKLAIGALVVSPGRFAEGDELAPA
jgi:uncharacterized protein YcbX